MEPLHSANVAVIDALSINVHLWRNLTEMREQNDMGKRARCWALCYELTPPESGVIAIMHFARTNLCLELVAHECSHALDHISRTIGLELDEHDEEARATMAGQVLANVWACLHL
jgi:hypothetical protein